MYIGGIYAGGSTTENPFIEFVDNTVELCMDSREDLFLGFSLTVKVEPSKIVYSADILVDPTGEYDYEPLTALHEPLLPEVYAALKNKLEAIADVVQAESFTMNNRMKETG